MHALLTTETSAFLDSGCALLVGTVTPDGEPMAARGWGLTVEAGATSARLLVAADDPGGIAHVRVGDAVAITAASVRTLRSLQLKGRVTAIEGASDADGARADRFCDDFYGDLLEADGSPRSLTDHLTPAAFVVWLVEVEELFDQTPGPAAGQPVPG